MDVEAKMLLELELQGIADSRDHYALSGFRLAQVVMDRVTFPHMARVAAENLLVLFARSGVLKASVTAETLTSHVAVLSGHVREILARPGDPGRKPPLEAVDAVHQLGAVFGRMLETQPPPEPGFVTCARCGKRAKVRVVEATDGEYVEAWFEVPVGWWLRSAGMAIPRARCGDCMKERG